MKLLTPLLALILAAASPAFAQSGAPASSSGPVVAVQVLSPVQIVQGGQAMALIKVSVAPGYHVQANPASQPNYVATKVEILGGNGLTVGPSLYPKGKPYAPADGGETLSVLDGAFSIQTLMKTVSGAKAGPRSVAGTLRYQACDAKACLFPQSLNFNVPVNVITKAK